MQRVMNEQRYEALKASIQRGSLEVDYPHSKIETLAAFYEGFWRYQHATSPRNGSSGKIEHIDIQPLVAAFGMWPEREKWQFINHWCDDMNLLAYTTLIPLIKSTEELGHSGVIGLVIKEIEISKSLAVPPQEQRIAHWIKTYTGRINLLPDINRWLKPHFSTSTLIDEALAGQVQQYIGGHDNYNAVARDSDFFTATVYPQTFEKYLEHFIAKKLNFEVIEEFFKDMFISGEGIKPEYVASYRKVLGDDAVRELFSSHVISQHHCSGDAPARSFRQGLATFGEEALLETPQFQQHLVAMEADPRNLELLHWISEQYMALHELAPHLHEMCVYKLPELMRQYKFSPSSSIMETGVKLLGGEGFIRHYLGALRYSLDQDVRGVKGWSRFVAGISALDQDVKSISDRDLVEYAYSAENEFNNALAVSIRNACHFSGVREMAKVAGDMGIKASERLYTDVAYDQKKLVIEHFPNCQVLALERDLGL